MGGVMVNPCYECAKRSPRCHTDCRDYADWQKENEVVKANRLEINRIRNECAGDCARRSERARKKRRT